MIETRRLKNVVIFFQTIISFVLSRKIGKLQQQSAVMHKMKHKNFYISEVKD